MLLLHLMTIRKIFTVLTTKVFAVNIHFEENVDTEKSICYKLDVNEEQHAALQGIIEQMEASNIEWKYCMLGVILCLLGIRHKMKNAYFCSQFVAELLQTSGIMKWRKHPSLYLPNQLCREIRAHSGLRETIEFESIEVIDENGEKIEIC